MTTQAEKSVARLAVLRKLVLQEKNRLIRIGNKEAKKRKNQHQAEDNTRKYLLGALMMARLASGDEDQGELYALLDKFLARPRERKLFNLDKPAAVDPTSAVPLNKTPIGFAC